MADNPAVVTKEIAPNKVRLRYGYADAHIEVDVKIPVWGWKTFTFTKDDGMRALEACEELKAWFLEKVMKRPPA